MGEQSRELSDPCFLPRFLDWNRWVEGETPGAVYFTCETGEVWYPFHLRKIPTHWKVPGYDITSTYGFGGPLVKGDVPATLQTFLPYWEAFCQEQQVIAELIRFHPLRENHQHLDSYYEIKQAKEVVWVDLTASEETLWAQLHAQKRWDLKKAATKDLCFTTDKGHFEAFKHLYQQNMQAKHAKNFYHFPDAFYQALQQDLPQEDIWLHSVLHQNKVASSALFLASGKTVYYFLAGNAAEARELHSSPYLLWQTFLQAKALGYEKLFLGGGLTHHDSLYQFKRRFSPHVAPYLVGTRIHDAARYSALKSAVLAENPKHEIPDGYLFFYRDIPIAWK